MGAALSLSLSLSLSFSLCLSLSLLHSRYAWGLLVSIRLAKVYVCLRRGVLYLITEGLLSRQRALTRLLLPCNAEGLY